MPKISLFYAWLSWAAVTDRQTDIQRVPYWIFPFVTSKALGDVLSKEGLIPEIGTDFTFSLYVHLRNFYFSLSTLTQSLGGALHIFLWSMGQGEPQKILDFLCLDMF